MLAVPGLVNPSHTLLRKADSISLHLETKATAVLPPYESPYASQNGLGSNLYKASIFKGVWTWCAVSVAVFLN